MVSRERLKTLPDENCHQRSDEGTWRDWLFSNPTEVTPEL